MYTVNYSDLVTVNIGLHLNFDSVCIMFFCLISFMQYRYASRWDLFVIFLGCVCTLMKSLTLPWVVIVYGEFTSLMVERSIGSSSPTILMKLFGGGRILLVLQQFYIKQLLFIDIIRFVFFFCFHFKIQKKCEPRRKSASDD